MLDIQESIAPTGHIGLIGGQRRVVILSISLFSYRLNTVAVLNSGVDDIKEAEGRKSYSDQDESRGKSSQPLDYLMGGPYPIVVSSLKNH